ncbi:GPI-anchored wall transfer protein [Metarhizium album ARSEF 1941]|uniref:GPI-anchored wall transfer protein n=1 Tax=Metarhizium album (strain ARSEF 1941) TaxID=1081103 RepID=A0A0B2WMN2_METAS|nr:GPI-anchored wall transfer protein [Metarhizium album ARSEF 1941]KHN94250.1 GPI-anchored wall transfer protein [Metarhizium album ARSEF 1941]
MSNQSYKQQKEDFVSNHSGGSVAEIAAVTAVAPVAILLWSALQSRQSFFRPYTPLSCAVDFSLCVGTFLLSTTLYASTPLLLILFLLAPLASVYMLPAPTARKKRPIVPKHVNHTAPHLDVLPAKPFLTSYRGAMMVMTCVSILAVDFRLFPRRFAKVETWGTSLMDMGVGSFVFTAGVVAARPVLRERASGKSVSLARRLIYSARHSAPLLVLGVARLLSVKGLDYAEHVTEYGVHWNFFFTLGLLPPFVATFQAVLRYVPSHAALALLVGGAYEVLLGTTTLKAYVLAAPRTDLLSMNREGLFSFLGYLAIFLAGQDLGMFIIPRAINPRSQAAPGTQRNTLLMAIAVWAAIWSALYHVCTSHSFGLGLGVSRRLANLPYVLWVASFNTIQIFACCLIDTVFFPATYSATDGRTEREANEFATSRVLKAFNRNGLAVFLLANLLTGLVNMTIRTIDVGPVVAMAVLLGYMGVVTGFAVVLDVYDISIKL